MAKCEDCEKEAVLLRDDGIGWCYFHVIDYAQKELDKEREEEETGVSEFDITNRAFEKKITLEQAKAELLEEVNSGNKE